MQLDYFNQLPVNIQNFIKETNIDIAHVCSNDFRTCNTKQLMFTIPYGLKGGGKCKVTKSFSSFDANRIKTWFNKLAV